MHKSGPLVTNCQDHFERPFFPRALDPGSFYNKSSKAVLAQAMHAPEEVCSQGDYLRHLKTALT